MRTRSATVGSRFLILGALVMGIAAGPGLLANAGDSRIDPSLAQLSARTTIASQQYDRRNPV